MRYSPEIGAAAGVAVGRVADRSSTGLPPRGTGSATRLWTRIDGGVPLHPIVASAAIAAKFARQRSFGGFILVSVASGSRSLGHLETVGTGVAARSPIPRLERAAADLLRSAIRPEERDPTPSLTLAWAPRARRASLGLWYYRPGGSARVMSIRIHVTR